MEQLVRLVCSVVMLVAVFLSETVEVPWSN